MAENKMDESTRLLYQQFLIEQRRKILTHRDALKMFEIQGHIVTFLSTGAMLAIPIIVALGFMGLVSFWWILACLFVGVFFRALRKDLYNSSQYQIAMIDALEEGDNHEDARAKVDAKFAHLR